MNLPRDPRKLTDEEHLICQIAGSICGSFMATRWFDAPEGLSERCIDMARLIVQTVKNR